MNYKRLGNFYLNRIMQAGAIGCELVFSGKLAGERSRKERFAAGYLKKAGDTAERFVLKGFAVATPRLGNVGITVKIMIKYQEPSVADIKAREEAVNEHGNTQGKEDTRNE